jgi:hypothetical protein
MVEPVAWQLSAFLLPPCEVSFTLPDDLLVSTFGKAGARYGHSIISTSVGALMQAIAQFGCFGSIVQQNHFLDGRSLSGFLLKRNFKNLVQATGRRRPPYGIFHMASGIRHIPYRLLVNIPPHLGLKNEIFDDDGTLFQLFSILSVLLCLHVSLKLAAAALQHYLPSS